MSSNAKKPLILPLFARTVRAEWPWSRLDEIADVYDCPHSTPALVDDLSAPFVVRSQDVRSGSFLTESAARVSHETYVDRIKRVEPRFGDLVYSREGTYFGIAAEVPRAIKVCLGQRMVLIRPDARRIDHAFLKYWLNSPLVFGHIHGFRDGTVAERLNLPVIRGLPVTLPSVAEQREMAGTLSALDDRISLLRETNATLEAIAQALFKSWFVDFDPVRAKQQGLAPEGMDEATAALFPDGFEESELGLVPRGWQVGELADILTLRNERTKPSEQTLALPYVPIESISAKVPFLQEHKSGKDANSSLILFREGDILFGAMRPYFHKVCAAPFDGVTRTTVFTLTPADPKLMGFALFQAYQETTIGYATQHSEGSTIPYAKWSKSLERMPIILPPEPVQKAFSSVVASFIQRANKNIQQAQTLADLRDTLLPRLISGQLRLPEAEAILEVA